MKKKLLKNISEYRKWAFKQSENGNHYIDRALGLSRIYDCWDYNEAREEIDEKGNVIPEDTAENVELEDWVEELKFPIIAVYTFDKEWDRQGNFEIVVAEFVSISDFK